MKKLFGILSLIFCLASFAESNKQTITGYAPDFVGQKVSLYAYADYITMTRIEIGNGVVNEKDSLFKIEFEIAKTIQAIIEIQNTEAELYLQPNSNYQITYYKPKNAPITFANQYADFAFYGLDSTDINYRVLQYNQWFDNYIYYNQKNIVQKGFAPYLDTFKIYAYEAYKNVQDPYFINYVRYNIALMEQAKVKRNVKNAKYNSYLEYIYPFPVYSNNDQYMKFVNGYYPKDFEHYIPNIKTGVIMAIDHASPSRLMTALRKDPLLKKDELRELMMIKMLGKSYYNYQYPRKNIVVMLDSVSRYAKFKPNAIVAKNMLTYLTKIENGYPAPEINFKRDNGDVVNWISYEGKFVYVNFFASWNQVSTNEMKLIETLKVKYGEYISFVSFCTDKTEQDFENFKEKHENYTWDMFYIGENSDLQKDFNVATIPAYFLIDQSGFIAQAPALSPAPNGLYKTVEETFKYIQNNLEKN